jgi:fatty-acyl-CoA synthase
MTRLAETAERAPGRIAAIEAASGRTRTFAELETRSARLARALADAGIGEADHIGILLPNVIEYFDIIWATLRSGLVLTPVNWHLTSEERGYILADSCASALLTSPDLIAMSRDASGTPVSSF